MQMRQRDVAALDANTRRSCFIAKAEMMLCVMTLSLVVVGCTSKQSGQSRVKPPRFRRIMQPPPDWQTPLKGLFHPQRERLDHYAKTTEGTQKYINEQCR